MSEDKLNPNQRLFCELYAGEGKWFGNATRAYIIAYKIDLPVDIEYKNLLPTQISEYNTASSAAVQLLRNIKVQKKCNELLDALIKDEIVDRELAKVIMQNDELPAKVSAIKEYNAVRKRTSSDVKVNVEISPVSESDLSDYLKWRKSKQ